MPLIATRWNLDVKKPPERGVIRLGVDQEGWMKYRMNGLDGWRENKKPAEAGLVKALINSYITKY